MTEKMQHAILGKKNELAIAYYKRPITDAEMKIFLYVQKLLDDLLEIAKGDVR